ncbi:Outer dense fiber protein [Operophtera brumata]|uniref:Outer dense fiber protein n=1 Tax=Operophtera brumata TaxID=104452 RepID=A0A0L7LAL7_OPEBR|nr:Outer dense fiber protein [Operophtera brumata]
MAQLASLPKETKKCTKTFYQGHKDQPGQRAAWRQERAGKCINAPKKSRSCKYLLSGDKLLQMSSPLGLDDDPVARQIRDIHNDTRKSARIIRDSKARLLELQKKTTITEADVKELCERNELLLREMERFDRLTRSVQKLVAAEVTVRKPREYEEQSRIDYIPGTAYEPALHQEMKMNHPAEIDLTRKLSESYDMQEKLVADNADLEVKRYILYKELMSKDQSLETCRAQEKQVSELELEVRHVRVEMASIKHNSACAGPGGQKTCFDQPCGVCPPCPAPCNPNGPPTPAEREVQKLTVQLRQTEETFKNKVTEKERCLHREVQTRLRDFEIKFEGLTAHTKMMLGSKEQALDNEVNVRSLKQCYREAREEVDELRLLLKEQNVQLQEYRVKQCYREAREEVDELRLLLKEQNVQLQEYRVKQCYREARKEVDELRLLLKEQNVQLQEYRVKQCYREAREEVDELRLLLKEQNVQLQEYRVKMDMMDMDNTRISEQINLEIQRVKSIDIVGEQLKFQEKLQELSSIPELLKATQMRLKDSQQSQAIAEHAAEQLTRELNCAREKVHMMLHNSLKPPEKQERGTEDKQIVLLQQRVTQLTDANATLKTEIERLKLEKMHECAQLGGELDRARDEGARAVQRANERADTIRKCMQTSVAEMERQLAAARAQVKVAEKDREEALRRTASSTGEGDGGDEAEGQQECTCKSLFENI